MSPLEQRIERFLNGLQSELREGYFHKLIVREQQKTQEQIHQTLMERNSIKHSESGDYIPPLDTQTPARETMPIYASVPNIDDATKLGELFRTPEGYEHLLKQHSGVLSDCLTNYGCSTHLKAATLLTETDGSCLVQLVSGEITFIHSSQMRGNKDVQAILMFPTQLTSYCVYTALYRPVDNLDYAGEVRALDLAGMFSDCPNLVYITSIPEGVRDLQFAFQNCPKLNCSIYIPSTVTRLYGMLNECNGFHSPVYIHKTGEEIPGTSTLVGEIVYI